MAVLTPKLHYIAYDLGWLMGNCIIMQFLGAEYMEEKRRTNESLRVLNAESQSTDRKVWRMRESKEKSQELLPSIVRL